jgi:hypothetical protein
MTGLVKDNIDGIAYMQELEKRDNTNYSKALQELCPGTHWAVSGTDYSTLQWAEWNTVPKPTKQELDDKVAELEERWVQTQYRRDRVKEYPPLADQIDALWKGGDAAEAMLQKVMDVKNKYPKPEVN